MIHPSEMKDFEAAIELFDRAREADPNFVDALAMAAHMRLRYIFFFRPENTDALLEEARGLLQTAMRLDQRNATCHCAMGRLHYMLGEHESAVSMCREAIALNPNSVFSHFEMAVAFGGLRRWKEMLEHFDMARRLSPRDPHTAAAYAGRAVSLFQLGRYQECVDSALTASLSPNPRYWADVVLVAALTVLGRTAEAESAKKVLLARKPDFTLAGLKNLHVLNTESVHDALRKAGLPE